MSVEDRTGVLERVRQGEQVALELGCGSRKRHSHAIGVDSLGYEGVDLVGDVFDVLAEMPDECVTSVHAYHFFEHVEDISKLLRQLARVMLPGAVLDVEVPHFSNPYFYSDPTHSRFFGLYTFCYLAETDLFSREVPQYGIEPRFRLTDVQLQFDSPFPVRGLFRRSIGRLFNLSRWLQEFHEENLCHVFACYQLRYTLHRL